MAQADLADYVRALVADWPRLTAAQRDAVMAAKRAIIPADRNSPRGVERRRELAQHSPEKISPWAY